MTKMLTRKNNLASKVIFIDGLPGCGKTLFSMLVSTMKNVELLSYMTDVENICALSELDKISIDASEVMIKISTDLKIYQTMMGRDVNFRVTDLSSAINYHNPNKYLKRLFEAGDEKIPELIKKENPILNIATHNLLPYSKPIWNAIGDKSVFLNIVRHPLYMVRQQSLNMKRMIGTARHFSIYYQYNDHELPHFVKGWEDSYISSNAMERVIFFIKYLTSKTVKVIDNETHNILTVPFEQFVLNPTPWMEKIAKAIGTEITDTTRKVMKEQNVPRDMVAQGIDLDIYCRCGWLPPKDGSTERDELNIRREDVAREVSSDVLVILDGLSKEYEEKYWNPDI